MQQILHEMRLAVDHDGEGIFESGTVDKVAKRAVDGCLWHVQFENYLIAKFMP